MDSEAISRRFRHHPPRDQSVVDAHVAVRVAFEELAHKVNVTLPDCEEKRRAIDTIDLAAMLTNAGIARTQLNPNFRDDSIESLTG